MKIAAIALFVAGLGVASAGMAHTAEKAGADALAGDWAGSWSGPTTGTFEMTLAQSAEGELSGNISTHSEAGEESTNDFASVATQDDGFVAVFEPNEGVVVTMTGTIVDGAPQGSYEIKTGEQVTETGTWTAARP